MKRGRPVAGRWHYLQNDEPHGPVSAHDLRRLVSAGRLKPTDLVWQEDTPDWIRAGRVKGLFPRPAPPASAEPEPDDGLQPAANDGSDASSDTSAPAAMPPRADNHAFANGQPPAVTPPDLRADVERPLPVVLVAIHAAVTAAVLLLQAGSTGGVDLGSQLDGVTDMLGGMLGDALGDALGTEGGLGGGGITLPQPAVRSIGWLVSLVDAMRVPMIVFFAAACYGLLKRQWWARRLTLVTYLAPVLLGLLALVLNLPLGFGTPTKLLIEAAIAAAVLFYFTRLSTRDYFGDGPITFRDLLVRPLRRSDPDGA